MNNVNLLSQSLSDRLFMSMGVSREKPLNIEIYFWDKLLELANIILIETNKYILVIDTFSGILR